LPFPFLSYFQSKLIIFLHPENCYNATMDCDRTLFFICPAITHMELHKVLAAKKSWVTGSVCVFLDDHVKQAVRLFFLGIMFVHPTFLVTDLSSGRKLNSKWSILTSQFTTNRWNVVFVFKLDLIVFCI
jgi:hypothetical protein